METDSKNSPPVHAEDASCPVCGWQMGRSPVVRIIGEVEWRFCCFGCASTHFLMHLLRARGVMAGKTEDNAR